MKQEVLLLCIFFLENIFLNNFSFIGIKKLKMNIHLI